MKYSRYVDYIDVMGGWVPVENVALKFNLSYDTVMKSLYRLANINRVELRLSGQHEGHVVRALESEYAS